MTNFLDYNSMNFIYNIQPEAISTVKFEGWLNLQIVLVFFFRFFRPWLNSKQKEELSRRVCLFKPRVFRTYKLPPFLKTTRSLVEEMLEKTLIIRPSSTFLPLYTSCWTLGNPFTYHHSPHFPALPRRLYALMIEWISQLKTILSDGHNGLRGSSSFLMSQNVWKWLKKNLTLVFQQFVYIVSSKFYSPHFFQESSMTLRPPRKKMRSYQGRPRSSPWSPLQWSLHMQDCNLMKGEKKATTNIDLLC